MVAGGIFLCSSGTSKHFAKGNPKCQDFHANKSMNTVVVQSSQGKGRYA